MNSATRQLIVVSGRSGSGKTLALKTLEDAGFYCVDNLPTVLLRSLLECTLIESNSPYDKVVAAVDARNLNSDMAQIPPLLDDAITDGISVTVVFLDAEDSVLLQRFKETRRRHPLGSGDVDLRAAISREREFLQPLRERASVVIDTTALDVKQLRQRVMELGELSGSVLNLQFLSFGFSRGTPIEADLMFDVRCLPNPHWERTLREMDGRDRPVAEFLNADASVERMFEDIRDYLQRWLPEFEKEDRNYLTVALGCTGGRHRSVYFAERLRDFFCERYPTARLRHRDLKESNSMNLRRGMPR